MVIDIMPAGGPHSSFDCEFQQQVVFFANLGFAVLMGKEVGAIFVYNITVCSSELPRINRIWYG